MYKILRLQISHISECVCVLIVLCLSVGVPWRSAVRYLARIKDVYSDGASVVQVVVHGVSVLQVLY